MQKPLRLRSIDRAVLGFIATLMVAGGVYLAGPWYLEQGPDGTTSPIYGALNSLVGTKVFGTSFVISGLLVFLYSLKSEIKKIGRFANILLVAFILRLFALTGNLLTLESWKPPSYLTSFCLLFILGGYYVWVKSHERITD